MIIKKYQVLCNGSDTYLICGTTNPTPNTGYGLIYIGDINCQNGVQFIQKA
jgi:hypothetical protein